MRDMNLDIRRGEFIPLLGPSGSGKSTTLMMLAGFEQPTTGEILLEGKALGAIPAYKRNFGMVFQNYALFPHMSILENVAFPLHMRRVSLPTGSAHPDLWVAGTIIPGKQYVLRSNLSAWELWEKLDAFSSAALSDRMVENCIGGFDDH